MPHERLQLVSLPPKTFRNWTIPSIPGSRFSYLVQTAGAALDVYFLDQFNFQLFKDGKEFLCRKGVEGAEVVSETVDLPTSDGSWSLVVRNRSDRGISAQVTIHW